MRPVDFCGSCAPWGLAHRGHQWQSLRSSCRIDSVGHTLGGVDEMTRLRRAAVRPAVNVTAANYGISRVRAAAPPTRATTRSARCATAVFAAVTTAVLAL